MELATLTVCLRIPATLLFLASCAPAAARWNVLASAHFEVLTDGGIKRAREVTAALEQVRAIWTALEKPLPGSLTPARVVVFRDAGEFARFRRSAYTGGFFQSGTERDYLVLSEGEDTLRTARHEFVHLAAERQPGWPGWMEEGLAEVYSGLGSLPARHVAFLKTEPWLPAVELLTLRGTTIQDNDPAKLKTFYAESWALVAWLRQQGLWKAGAPAYLRARREQPDEAAAFAVGFGDTALHALAEARRAVMAEGLRGASFKTTAPQLALPTAREMSSDEADAMLADLALAVHRPELAQVYAKRLEQRGEGDADRLAERALLALRLERTEDAEQLFRRAVEGGTRRPAAYLEWATLVRDRHGPASEVEALAAKATELHPGYAEAYYLLGCVRRERKDYAGSAEALEHAVELLPRRAAFWIELSDARLALGQRAAARAAAEEAVAAAEGKAERESALGLLRRIDMPQAAPTPKPETTTSAGWTPKKGDAEVEGLLVFVDCTGQTLKFQIAAGGRRYVLETDQPNLIVLSGHSGVTREFICGAQKRTPVRAEYTQRPDARRRIDGEITALEFR